MHHKKDLHARNSKVQVKPSESDTKLNIFPSGASRSKDCDELRFDLIPTKPHARLARRYGGGAATHGANNWRKGMPWSDVINHLENHLNRFKAGNQSDDDLAAIAWGAFTLMEYEETHQELDDRVKEAV